MITTLTGGNSFALHTELKRLVDDFLKEHSDMGLERLDGEEVEFDRIRESLQSLPFLASKKLVVLRNPSAQKQFIEQAEKLLVEVPETTDVILVETKLDKRSSYFKFLKSKTDFHEFNELSEQELSTWLVQKAKDLGGELSPSDARFLAERVGANQQLLGQEIEKLIHYDPKISRDTIGLLTEPSHGSTIFQLIDAAINGRVKQAIELYDEQRLQKVEPYAIIGMLAWQLHVLAIIKTAGERTDSEIAKEAKLNPFVVGKSKRIARKLQLIEIKKLTDDLLDLDIRLKSESIDPDEALKAYLLKLGSIS